MQAPPLEEVLHACQGQFSPVVPFDAGRDKLIKMDFSRSNTDITQDIATDIVAFCNFVDLKLLESGALYGIGGYSEERTLYAGKALFNSDTLEPRSFHLGMDIWGPAGTLISAPLDSLVHSCANNDTVGDYGSTIILQHELEGIQFYTLYGHLSRAPLSKLRVGEKIKKGKIFAHTGLPSENGTWPPHLHFQIINDIGVWKGDYPGVCRVSEKQKWISNSPDPDLILDLNRFL